MSTLSKAIYDRLQYISQNIEYRVVSSINEYAGNHSAEIDALYNIAVNPNTGSFNDELFTEANLSADMYYKLTGRRFVEFSSAAVINTMFTNGDGTINGSIDIDITIPLDLSVYNSNTYYRYNAAVLFIAFSPCAPQIQSVKVSTSSGTETISFSSGFYADDIAIELPLSFATNRADYVNLYNDFTISNLFTAIGSSSNVAQAFANFLNPVATAHVTFTLPSTVYSVSDIDTVTQVGLINIDTSASAYIDKYYLMYNRNNSRCAVFGSGGTITPK